MRSVTTHWAYDPITVISLPSVAPFLSDPVAPDNPPVRTLVNFDTIARQWVPPYRPIPKGARIANLIQAPIVPDNPPKMTYAVRNLIIDQWRPPYIPIPKLRISETATVMPPAVPSETGIIAVIVNRRKFFY